MNDYLVEYAAPNDSTGRRLRGNESLESYYGDSLSETLLKYSADILQKAKTNREIVDAMRAVKSGALGPTSITVVIELPWALALANYALVATPIGLVSKMGGRDDIVDKLVNGYWEISNARKKIILTPDDLFDYLIDKAYEHKDRSSKPGFDDFFGLQKEFGDYANSLVEAQNEQFDATEDTYNQK